MRISRVVIAPYAAEDMYALVDDIAAYPRFLPWCAGADVERDGGRVRATLHIRYGGIRTAFTTENAHTPASHIAMRLVRGPLASLAGDWRFMPLDARRCRIEFDLHYAFKNRILDAAFSGVFSFVFDHFVDHFVRHARATYGDAPPNKIAVDVVRVADGGAVRRVLLPAGATVADALAAADGDGGGGADVGIFGRLCSPQTPLKSGDRVEVHQPLANDPRAARRKRAAP